MVEFALILPIMLGLFGAVADMARLYSAWITVESATRDAAEYVATNDSTSAAASTDAQRVVCLQAANLPGFASPPGNQAACTRPVVTVTSFSVSTAASLGATPNHPVATATVETTLVFNTIFPYPFLTNEGGWTLSSTRTYSIVQGRR